MATDPTQAKSEFNEELWSQIFGVGHPLLIEKQAGFRKVGAAPRCKLCLAPFNEQPGEPLSADVPGPSNRNPRFCSLCDGFVRDNPGGAKVRLGMVFADVRGSTRLSEELELREYVRLINQFYATTTGVFVETDGFMMDILGDEVFALYPTGFSGVTGTDETPAARERTAAEKAFLAVTRLVRLSEATPPEGLSFGVSLHNAEVYIGTVRGAEEGISDVRVWGPEVNKAARMCAAAQAGEVLISPEAVRIAGIETSALESRQLSLRGLAESVPVYSLRA